MSASPEDVARLLSGSLAQPERVLGPRAARRAGADGALVRAYHPAALAAACLLEDGRALPMQPLGDGLFEAFVPAAAPSLRYRLRFAFPEGHGWEVDDAYRFAPALDDEHAERLERGGGRGLWQALGAHPRSLDGTPGMAFAVRAPGAERVSVVGDFCHWDGRLWPMRRARDGWFALFLPGLPGGLRYRYEVKRSGVSTLLDDPFAFELDDAEPAVARTPAAPCDAIGAVGRARRLDSDAVREAVAIGSVDVVAFAAERGELHGAALAGALVAEAGRFALTHLLLERAFAQAGGGFAPSGRLGGEGLRALVGQARASGVGLLAARTPRALAAGTQAARELEVAGALHAVEALGLDGLCLDLPPDWSASGRPGGDAGARLAELLAMLRREHPGCLAIVRGSDPHAELAQPPAPGVSFDVDARWREPAERWLAGGKDGLERRPDTGARPPLLALEGGSAAAPDRVLVAWHWTQPGKKLVRLGDLTRYGVDRLIADLAALYREQPSLWRWDGDPAAIRWLDRGARAEDVAAFLRLDGDAHVLVALHRGAQALGEWRAGVPARGRYRVRISTDDAPYGGAGSELPRVLDAEPRPSHGFAQSLALRLPPRSALVLVPEAM